MEICLGARAVRAAVFRGSNKPKLANFACRLSSRPLTQAAVAGLIGCPEAFAAALAAGRALSQQEGIAVALAVGSVPVAEVALTPAQAAASISGQAKRAGGTSRGDRIAQTSSRHRRGQATAIVLTQAVGERRLSPVRSRSITRLEPCGSAGTAIANELQ